MQQRKKRMTSAERHEQILEKAAEVFAQKGLEGARTREIADACGVNEALLYKHFPTKDDLFCESLRREHTVAIESWMKEIKATPDSLDMLQSSARAWIVSLIDNPQQCSNMVHAIGATRRNEQIKNQTLEWFDAQHAGYAELVGKAVKEGTLKADEDNDLLPLLVRSLIWGFLVFSVVGYRKDTAVQDFDRILGRILRELKPSDAEQTVDVQ